MARMIPPYISSSCCSPGERLLFRRFKEDPATSEWIVLHSFGVAKHPVRREGEIDFVVMVPGEGILCLEIKAGQVARENGVWKYGKEPFVRTSLVGPFRQASEGMHAIHKQVTSDDSDLGFLLFSSGVIFTLVDFHEMSPEWHSWQYADRSMLGRYPVSECCLHILAKAHDHIRKVPSAKWYDPAKSRPTKKQVMKLAGILRGDFEYTVSPRVALEEEERRIIKFTEDQFSALDVISENPRIVFKGPAGTGKTFLAIEAAKRATSSKKRTMLTCYNRLLGHWLSIQMRGSFDSQDTLLEVGTFHGILMNLAGMDSEDIKGEDFWTSKLPEVVVERALEGIINVPIFDYLIIDEAQDLLRDEYLDVLDLLLYGGLSSGKWVFFGDFERQAIYRHDNWDEAGTQDLLSILKQRSPHYFSFPLRTNCRNAEAIAVGIEITCGLKPGYSRILENSLEGDIDVVFYHNDLEQEHFLEKSLTELRNVFQPEEIVVLSSREDNSSAAGHLFTQGKFTDLTPLRLEAGHKGYTAFCSIHAFKGIESPAVIITDIENLRGDQASALTYVGMSRARLKLVIFLHARCRAAYTEMVRRGFILRRTKGESDGKARKKS